MSSLLSLPQPSHLFTWLLSTCAGSSSQVGMWSKGQAMHLSEGLGAVHLCRGWHPSLTALQHHAPTTVKSCDSTQLDVAGVQFGNRVHMWLNVGRKCAPS